MRGGRLWTVVGGFDAGQPDPAIRPLFVEASTRHITASLLMSCSLRRVLYIPYFSACQLSACQTVRVGWDRNITVWRFGTVRTVAHPLPAHCHAAWRSDTS